MNYPQIEGVTFDENEERLKVVFPVRRHVLFLSLYTVLLLVWLGVTGWMLYLLFAADISELGLTFLVVWILILLVWAYVWYRLGHNIWRWWQYYMATRELLLIDEETLVVHRPFFFLGVTDAYAREHISPFRYDEEEEAIAFAYGARAGKFGAGLAETPARRLVATLNRRFFPGALEEDGA